MLRARSRHDSSMVIATTGILRRRLERRADPRATELAQRAVPGGRSLGKDDGRAGSVTHPLTQRPDRGYRQRRVAAIDQPLRGRSSAPG